MNDSAKCPACGAKLAPGELCPQCRPTLKVGEAEATVGDQPADATIADERSAIIGPYKLLQKIGEGGMGTVWMAQQNEPIRRRVALKIIKLGMDTRQVIARFEAERQALALMDHPNIAKVFDAGATEMGRPFFVMELVRGVRITEYCDQNKLDTHERLKLFTQVCHAIQHAHQKGIIHRDIKPSNILVTSQDGVPAPKVIDFGIAKATDQQLTDKTLFTAFEQFIGTPAYMSPEQAEISAMDVDTRSDIYSLGVLLYELLTGRTPFDTKKLLAAGIDEIRRIIREEEPPRPSTCMSTLSPDEQMIVAKQRHSDPPKLLGAIRGDLDWIVMKALEKDRTRRYETANGFAADLNRLLSHEPVLARPPSALYRFERLVRRNKLAFGAVAAVAAAMVLGVAVSTWQAVRAKRAESTARAAELLATDNATRAVTAGLTAQTEARRAETAERQVRLHLATVFSHAASLIGTDQSADALAYLARSLSISPSNNAAVTRLTTLLTYRSWALPIATFQHSNLTSPPQISPDGKRILTASRDRTARLWDAQSGKMLVHLQHDGKVNSADFNFDGSRIITASADHTARCWDGRTGELLQTFRHTGPVNIARFSSDGTHVLSTSDDKMARIWDTATGSPLTEFKHDYKVAFGAFSPDGKRVLTVTNKTLFLWDAVTGTRINGSFRHGNRVEFAQFSPQGDEVVAIHHWSYSVDRWNAFTGQSLSAIWKHDSQPVTSLAFSRDGKQVVTTAGDRTARIWKIGDEKPVGISLKHSDAVETAEFSPDGRWVVTASRDFTVRLWDAGTGEAIGEPMNHGDSLLSACFSPDGRRVVGTCRNGSITVWDVRKGEMIPQTLGDEKGLSSVQFTPDGKQIVTTSGTRTARVMDTATGKIIAELEAGGKLHGARVSPDGLRILTISPDIPPCLWSFQNGRWRTELCLAGEGHAAEFSPDGQRVVTRAGNAARVWDVQTGLAVSEPMVRGLAIEKARFSPDGKRVVTASQDYTGRIWDAQTGGKLGKSLSHDWWVWWAEFSPDGKRVVTASSDKTARIWNGVNGELLTELAHPAGVASAKFSPDGKLVLTASDDGTARLWNAANGQQLTRPLQHERALQFARFSPHGEWVVTASWDRTARLWDVQTGMPLNDPWRYKGSFTVEGLTKSIEFSPDGRRIIPLCLDSAVRIWDVPVCRTTSPPWLIELAGLVSGKALNERNVMESPQVARSSGIEKIQNHLKQLPDDDDLVIWGRWFLADRSTRTISPFSKITVPEHLAQLARDNLSELPAQAKPAAGASTNTEVLKPAASGPDVSEQMARADTLRRERKWGEAAEVLREVLTNQQAVLGEDHRDTLATMSSLAGDLWTAGRRTNAVTLLEELLVRQRNKWGPENTNTVKTMGALASDYAALGRDADAERHSREMLRINRQLWTNQIQKIEYDILSVANLLQRQGKTNEWESLYAEFITPENEGRPEYANLLQWRAGFRARAARFKDSATDFTKAIHSNPSNQPNWFALAPLLIMNGDIAAYDAHCDALLTRFGSATNTAYWVERLAKVCLLRSGDEKRSGAAANLAGQALTLSTNSALPQRALRIGTGTNQISSPNTPPTQTAAPVMTREQAEAIIEARRQQLAQGSPQAPRLLPPASIGTSGGLGFAIRGGRSGYLLTSALSEYRQGHFVRAAELLGGVRNELERSAFAPREAQAWFVLAMTRCELKQLEEARAALATGLNIVETKLALPGRGDLGADWEEILTAHILMAEAQPKVAQSALEQKP